MKGLRGKHLTGAGTLSNDGVRNMDPLAVAFSAAVPPENGDACGLFQLAAHPRGDRARPPVITVPLAYPAGPELLPQVLPDELHGAVSVRPQELAHAPACALALYANVRLASRHGEAHAFDLLRHGAGRMPVLKVIVQGAVRMQDAVERPEHRHEVLVVVLAQNPLQPPRIQVGLLRQVTVIR